MNAVHLRTCTQLNINLYKKFGCCRESARRSILFTNVVTRKSQKLAKLSLHKINQYIAFIHFHETCFLFYLKWLWVALNRDSSFTNAIFAAYCESKKMSWLSKLNLCRQQCIQFLIQRIRLPIHMMTMTSPAITLYVIVAVSML